MRFEHLAADLFGLDSLTRAALSGRLESDGVATRAAAVPPLADLFLPSERARLAAVLEAKATAYAPHVNALDSIRTLKQPGACCVVSEAAPAILAGPLQQMFGALQTIAAARKLSTDECPVVPVLWVRSDEHETKSLSTGRVMNRHHVLQNVCLEAICQGTTPVAHIALAEKQHSLGALREVLRQLYGDFAHIEWAIDILTPRPGESLPQAFIRGMYELCGPLGLILIEPQDLREELSQACAVHLSEPLLRSVRETHGQLAKEHSVLRPANAPWFFHLRNGERQVLGAEGDTFRFENEPGSRTPLELAAEIVQSPSMWHPAHLTESLARSAALPVIAEVGKRKELERHMLLLPARLAFGWPQPAFIACVQSTLVDSHSSTSLHKLDITVEDVLGSQGQLDPHHSVPQAGPVLDAIEKIARDARTALKEQKKAVLEIGPTLKPALRTATRELTSALANLSTKVSHVAANRGGKLNSHRRRLCNSLCPDGKAQATGLNPFPWLAREGPGWLGDYCRELDPFSSEHLVVHLAE